MVEREQGRAAAKPALSPCFVLAFVFHNMAEFDGKRARGVCASSPKCACRFRQERGERAKKGGGGRPISERGYERGKRGIKLRRISKEMAVALSSFGDCVLSFLSCQAAFVNRSLLLVVSLPSDLFLDCIYVDLACLTLSLWDGFVGVSNIVFFADKFGLARAFEGKVQVQA